MTPRPRDDGAGRQHDGVGRDRAREAGRRVGAGQRGAHRIDRAGRLRGEPAGPADAARGSAERQRRRRPVPTIARRGPLAGVKLEQAAAVDGAALARVRVSLTRPSEYRVRSARNTIRVELTPAAGGEGTRRGDRGAGRSDRAEQPAAPTRVRRRSSSASAPGAPRGSTTVTFSGNGQLVPSSVQESSGRAAPPHARFPRRHRQGRAAQVERRQRARQASVRLGVSSQRAARHPRGDGDWRRRRPITSSAAARPAAISTSCSKAAPPTATASLLAAAGRQAGTPPSRRSRWQQAMRNVADHHAGRHRSAASRIAAAAASGARAGRGAGRRQRSARRPPRTGHRRLCRPPRPPLQRR